MNKKKPAVFIATDITSRNSVPELVHHSRDIDNVVTKDVQCEAVNKKNPVNMLLVFVV